MDKYNREDTVELRINVKDKDGNLVDPSALTLYIYNPSETLKSTVVISSLTHESLGVYYYNYSIPSDAIYGDWRYVFEYVYNILTNKNNEYFAVFDKSLETTKYCTVTDVLDFMQISASATSQPSVAEIENIIIEVMDFIDKHTHHAWRPTLISDEYYDFVGFTPQYERFGDWSDRGRCYMKHREIHAFVSGTHKIEIWNGSAWEDFVSKYTESRTNDYWIDYNRGIIHFANRYPWRMRHSIRLTYLYGGSEIPGSIRRAAKYMVAAELLQSEDMTVLLPEGTSNIPIADKSRMWEEKALKILEPFIEMVSW